MKLSDFDLDGISERASLADTIASFNRTSTEYPRDCTVHAVFADRAAMHADAEAVSDGTRSLTYAALDRASTRLAHQLRDAGVAAEDVVSLIVDDGLALVTAFVASLKAGAAYCPLEPDTPLERMRHIVSDTRSTVLLTDRDHVDTAEHLSRALSGAVRVVVVDPIDLDDGRDVLLLAERTHARGLAYVMYTSGTSGVPKGVLVEHRSILRLVVNGHFPLGPSTRILSTGSAAFDASTFEVWGALLNGGTIVRPGRMTVLAPSALREAIARHRITIMWLTASLFNQMVDADVAMFSPLETLISGGERLSPIHVERVRRAHPALRLINGYGPTENTTFTTSHTIVDADGQDVPIGRPVANCDVIVVDTFGQLVGPGVAGEILAGGDGLARGYLGDAALTADRFRPHPLRRGERIYMTRDRGRWTDAGVVEFLGRLDAQVKIRGYRVEPGEIEACCRACEGVTEAVVVVRDDPGGERVLVAYVTGRIDDGVLADHLRARLPAYMTPRSVVVLERLPLNVNGKVDAAALPPPDWSRHATAESVPCKTETERALAAIWRDMLGVDTIGAGDNFFDLGGHSLTAVKLVAAIQQRTGVVVPLAAIFRSQTVREMADEIVELARYGSTLADAEMVSLGGPSDAPPVFAFPPGTGDVLSYIPLAARWPHVRLYAFNFIEAPTRLSDYADLIAQTQPEGACVLLGYSAGGNLAFHAAGELERRGRQVSRIVMIDSARIVSPYPFLEDEIRRTADEFLAHPTIQPYCATPALRDKVVRRITAFYRLLSQTTDQHTVSADIDVLVSADATLEGRYDGRLISSVPAWASATTGRFNVHQGAGTHNTMLMEPAIDTNARLLEAMMAGAQLQP
jgi:amino acid adenylation domain-containing protein